MEKTTTLMSMTELPAEELASILRQGAILRLPYLEGRLLQAREQVRRFEEKYGMTLDVLSSQGLPDDADYEMHEDFIEWEYWSDVLHKTGLTIRNVKTLLEKAEETVGVR
jgi:hypothetical protein